MKRILLIAYHFPPIRLSSGIQRTLKFAQYLPDFDWQPMVLSINPRAYPVTSNDQMAEIAPDMVVKRAFGLDSSRHLAIKGRYFNRSAMPDQYATWWFDGVRQGKKLIKQYQPDIIWSTFPIASAHNIAYSLHQASGIPWVADFRDSMTEDGYPTDPLRRQHWLKIEKKTIAASARTVFTTAGAVAMYQQRYPDIDPKQWALINNGFDEENFIQAEQQWQQNKAKPQKKLVLVHAGILYPSERDPRAFFGAIAKLKKVRAISTEILEIRLRATAHDELFKPMLKQYGIDDIVKLAEGVPYQQALVEMLEADGLLLFQAANCNHQIPAKLYEYLRAQRPIFALTDIKGNTSQILTAGGVPYIVDLANEEAIQAEFLIFIQALQNKMAFTASTDFAQQFSRYAATEKLAKLLDNIMSEQK